MLLGGSLARLSNDVDLIAQEGDRAAWAQAVHQVARRFNSEVYDVTEDPRDHGGLEIPAVHFLVRYPTVFPSDNQPDIELDIVFAPTSFPA